MCCRTVCLVQFCGTSQWAVCLLLLLAGETQFAAQQLPIANLLEYANLKWAIMQQVSHTPKKHHQCFHLLMFSELGRSFGFFSNGYEMPAEGGCWQSSRCASGLP